MKFGLLVSAAFTAFALLVALGRIGHPIDGQILTTYGWSGVIIGVALCGFFAFLMRVRNRHPSTPA